MQDNANPELTAPGRTPWNKGKLTGARPPLRQETRLGNPDEAADRATNPRSGAIQFGHRQQIARL
jgi:hypothetical protein